jgi:hypothetical protein
MFPDLLFDLLFSSLMAASNSSTVTAAISLATVLPSSCKKGFALLVCMMHD